MRPKIGEGTVETVTGPIGRSSSPGDRSPVGMVTG